MPELPARKSDNQASCDADSINTYICHLLKGQGIVYKAHSIFRILRRDSEQDESRRYFAVIAFLIGSLEFRYLKLS